MDGCKNLSLVFVYAHTRGGAKKIDFRHSSVEYSVKVRGADGEVVRSCLRKQVRATFESSDKRVISEDKQDW